MDENSTSPLTIYFVFVIFFFFFHSLYLGVEQAFYFTIFVTILSAIILFTIDMVFEDINFHEELRVWNISPNEYRRFKRKKYIKLQ